MPHTTNAKRVPFTDEFDWCEEGVLVVVKGYGERYAVRAKGDQVWAVDRGKHLYEVDDVLELSTHNRCICQKVIHEVHRPLTNREFAEFMQDHKGCVKDDVSSMIFYSYGCHKSKEENDDAPKEFRFRFRGTEEWHPVTTELYEIAKGLDA